METLKRVIAILGIIAGILISLLWFWSVSFVVINTTNLGFFEEIRREPESLLVLLLGLALIAFSIWYLFWLEKQKKEEE